MVRFFKAMVLNLDVAVEVLALLWKQRFWWLIPMVAVLLTLGLLLVLASTSGLGPFIYTIF